MTPEFFQGFADLLAEEVQRELEARGVPLLASTDKGIKPERHIGRNFLGHDGVYQASMVVEWPRYAEKMPAESFLKGYVRKWAVEMGLKLARPGILSTYEMEIPRGVTAVALGRAADVVLRCVMDYSVFDDMEALRVDALAKWNI